jgi:hypothetical protein
MKRYLSLGTLSLLLMLTGVAVAAEGRGGWELMGRREVDFRGDHDRIEIGKREGRYRQLEFRVEGAPIEMYDMTVTFANGQTFKPNLRHRFAEGSGSRAIDLPGDRRAIRYVDFRYRTIDRREGKARIALYAR